MSDTTALVPFAGSTLDTETLEGLATIANREHRETLRLVESGLQHALRCGAALREAKKRIPYGRWKAWVADNLEFKDFGTISTYVRLATYKEQLDEAGTRTVEGSLAYLRELALPNLHPHPNAKTIDVNEARQLRKHGMSWEGIGTHFGVDRHTVQRQIDPDFRKRLNSSKRERRRATKQAQAALRKAEDRAERDRLAKATKGQTSSTYAMLRRVVVEVDRVIVQSDRPDVRANMRDALALLHKAEDKIVEALKAERVAS